MAINTTGSAASPGNIRPGVDTFYNRTLLTRLLPELFHAEFADKKPFKMRSGKRMKFRRWEPLAPNTAPLTEGVAPTGKQMASTEVEVSIQHYGDVMFISDEVDMTVEDPILAEAAMLLGEQAGLSIDIIFREVLNGGTARYRVGTDQALRSSVNGKISSVALEIALRTLRRNNVKKFTKGINASTGVGTLPVRSAYWAICHPDLIRDLENLADWVPVSKYAAQTGVHESEAGAWKDIRVLTTTNAKVWADSGVAVGATGLLSTGGANIDVYSLIILGQHAYAVCSLGGDNAKNIRKGFTEGGPSNPLEQVASSGWTVWTTAVILDDRCLFRIECGATA